MKNPFKRKPTREEVERGSLALDPFVKAGWLSANPEDLDELAYAVLLHARSNHSREEIEAAVEAQIAEYMAEHQRMLDAMDRAYEKRVGTDSNRV